MNLFCSSLNIPEGFCTPASAIPEGRCRWEPSLLFKTYDPTIMIDEVDDVFFFILFSVFFSHVLRFQPLDVYPCGRTSVPSQYQKFTIEILHPPITIHGYYIVRSHAPTDLESAVPPSSNEQHPSVPPPPRIDDPGERSSPVATDRTPESVSATRRCLIWFHPSRYIESPAPRSRCNRRSKPPFAARLVTVGYTFERPALRLLFRRECAGYTPAVGVSRTCRRMTKVVDVCLPIGWLPGCPGHPSCFAAGSLFSTRSLGTGIHV